MPRAPVEEWSSTAYRQSRRFSAAARKLGLRVRELRQERELTLQGAADRTGLDLKHFQKVEAGQINLTLVTLLRIADGLGVELSDLFVAGPRPARRR